MIYKEYKVEYRLYRSDGNEYQMRKIPLKTDSEDEVRQVLVEMKYIRENDKISILKISLVEEYSSYSRNDYSSNVSDGSITRKLIFYGACFLIGMFLIYVFSIWDETPPTNDAKGTKSDIRNNQTKNSSSHDIKSSKIIKFNSEMDFRVYINNKTFKSKTDNLTFRYVNSENTVYLKGIATGTLEVVKFTQESYGTIVSFKVRSAYSGNTARFSFAAPNTLFDETGREYE